MLVAVSAGPAATLATMRMTAAGSGDGAAEARQSAVIRPQDVAVTWHPSEPVQGTAFTVRVTPAGMAARSEGLPAPEIEGEAAGEPLHFEEDGTGGWFALAPVPIDVEGTLRLTVTVRWPGVRDTVVHAAVPVSRGDYALERLQVAPRYGQRPDSALQARIASETARARAVSRASHETPRQWSEPFLLPRPTRVTSGFGHGREFNGEVQSRHMGVDFAGGVGEPVRAANRGIVALVADFYLAGNAVYLDHGAGLVTGYFHLSSVEVREGEVVERGRVIGRVGATGRVTGPHLHWIARYGAVTVDPRSLLELDPTWTGAGQPQ